ncbi:putative cytochrome b, partial [Chlamydia psittaci 99DC5]
MMKLRLTPRILPNFTDHHRPVLSNTLLTRHLFCLLFNRTYHP